MSVAWFVRSVSACHVRHPWAPLSILASQGASLKLASGDQGLGDGIGN
ncbi:MAG TPA: hypothetical protein PL071_11670 [Nitrosomonas sp.]|nr:hypothetical protein [Nitrosomonas sp.]